MNQILLYWGSRPLTIKENSIQTIEFLKRFQKLTGITIFSLYGKEKLDLNNIIESSKILINWQIQQVKRIDKITVNENYNQFTSSQYSIHSDGKWHFENPECIVFQFAIGSSHSETGNSLSIKGKYLEKLNIPQIFKFCILFYYPDWGVISDYEIYKNQKISDYFTGWMTYFSNKKDIPLIPKKFNIEKVENLGIIVKSTDEVFKVNNEMHLKLAMELYSYFKDRNLNIQKSP